jgi:pilus assembly protein CpaB
MNVMRIAILGVAAIAAGAAALLVRGMIGGGTPASQAAAPPVAITTDVLVASKDIVPGHVLSVDLVRWDSWPKSAVSSTFITKDKQPDIAKAIAGAVVRSPLVAGQPISDANIVHAGAAGFLAATMTPGMRAIGMTVTAPTSAGGFILPNDRVDVVLTRELPGSASPKQYESVTLLRDVRVLAVDQTTHQEKDQQSVVGKTATLEMTPDQSEIIAHAEQSGVLSLTLRALGDSSGEPTTGNAARPRPARVAGENGEKSAVVIFRYGIIGGNSSAGSGSGGAGPGGTVVASNNSGGPASGPAPTPAPITNPITVKTTNIPAGVLQ